MPDDKVQFREDPALVRFVAQRGLNPNEVARLAFEAEVKRMKAEDKFDRLAARKIRLSRSPEESIREDRDR